MTAARRPTPPAPMATAQVPFVDLPVDASAVVADLAFAGRYVPAGPGPEPIAGDFYDVLRLQPDLIALLVGDVSGHSVEAVHRMRQLRAAARAYALDQPGPARVLARLDRFVHRLESDGLATLWYGEYRPSTGMLVYASAGHLPPLLHSDDAPVRLLQTATAPPLGTGVAHALAVEHDLVLPPGAVLVAYSDGLVERPGTDIDAQIDVLAGLVATVCDPASAGTADDIAHSLLCALVPEPGKARDDVCLLVVRRGQTAG